MWILFRSIDFVARSLGGPWTGWIGPAPVQMSGCCLGAALSWLCDGLLQGLVVFHWPFVSSWTVTLIILGHGFLRARVLWLCCTAAFPPIFLQLRKGPFWSCAELLQSYALCSSDQCRTVKLRLPAVRELIWSMLGRGDGGWRGIGVSGSIRKIHLLNSNLLLITNVIFSPLSWGRGRGDNYHIFLGFMVFERRIIMVTKYNMLERCCQYQDHLRCLCPFLYHYLHTVCL